MATCYSRGMRSTYGAPDAISVPNAASRAVLSRPPGIATFDAIRDANASTAIPERDPACSGRRKAVALAAYGKIAAWVCACGGLLFSPIGCAPARY
jgi:hypothetical protein